MARIQLYGMSGSGNCWKPVVLMRHLGIPFEWTEVDIVNGGSRTPEFLAMNPNGKVPLLVVDGRHLAESNAMLCYLADGTALLPDDRWQRAKVLEWLFFEQYSHEPNVATTRYWVKYLALGESHAAQIEEKRQRGHAALAVMERQLAQAPFLVGDTLTVADIALAAYTHVADEGGFGLDTYPSILAWLARVLSQPGIEPMARFTDFGSSG